VVIQSRIQIPNHFSTSLTIAECGILGDLLAFLIYSHRLTYTTLGEMTDADKVMNPHSGSDRADIRIRIQLISEIWIQILDQFWLRFVLSACSLVMEEFIHHKVGNTQHRKP